MELALPPPMKTSRSGSSSSLASAQSSRYEGANSEASFSRSRSRPSVDEARSSSSLGRSPLGESALASRRPSTADRAPSPATGAGGSVSHREDRLGDSVRKASTNEYEVPSQQRRPSFGGENNVRPGEGTSRRPSFNASNQEPPDTPKASRYMDDSAPTPKGPSNGNQNGHHERSVPAPIQPPSQLAPMITTTLPSPSLPHDAQLVSPAENRPQRRKSFHPAPVSTSFSREVLLTSRTGILPGAAGLTIETDRETAEDALLGNVEEMLEGFDWTAGVGSGVKKGSADAIESRLLDELAALDSVRLACCWSYQSLTKGKHPCLFGIR